jgi:hypothetical protein
MRQYVSAVRAKNNILSPLCLFVETMPIIKAVASENGRRFFRGKRHIQNRVGKNPGFLKKNPAQWVFWVLLGYLGFFGVFLGFFAQTRGFLGFFSVSRILLGASVVVRKQ